ncbi:MAG: response regulator [Candidatus Omnitrophica bacterium]|nr:response regulator [Candidatus Omnitrophota bacterium]
MARKILIVDDEAIITKSLQKLLKKEGYDITISQSGADAIEKVKSQDYDLLILDVRMPGMDGIETLQEIREYLKKENKSPIPEILITGFADEEKYKSAVSLKVADYIYKPFDTHEFLEVVKRNLDVTKG